ncbi:hypothetical protein LTS18_011013, partial [Coniosporium uncinatum]
VILLCPSTGLLGQIPTSHRPPNIPLLAETANLSGLGSAAGANDPCTGESVAGNGAPEGADAAAEEDATALVLLSLAAAS